MGCIQSILAGGRFILPKCSLRRHPCPRNLNRKATTTSNNPFVGGYLYLLSKSFPIKWPPIPLDFFQHLISVWKSTLSLS